MRATHFNRSNQRAAAARPGFGHNLPPPPMEPLAVRAREAARLLGVGERTVWTWIGSGRLKAHRVSDRITLVSLSSIRALLEGDGVVVRSVGKHRRAKEIAATAAQSL